MHDFHAADKILKMALEEAKKNKLKKIEKITIELGRIIEHGEEILAENLEFNIRMLAKNTIAEEAKILVIKKDGISGYSLKEIEGETI